MSLRSKCIQFFCWIFFFNFFAISRNNLQDGIVTIPYYNFEKKNRFILCLFYKLVQVKKEIAYNFLFKLNTLSEVIKVPFIFLKIFFTIQI